VVVAGETIAVPVDVAASLPTPWLIETVVASEVVQERVLELPGWMNAGDAAKEPIVGARLLGVTLFEGEEDAEVPAPFVAVTMKVYDCPFVRPDTTTGLTVLVAEMPPALAVAI
jgi:hypothetical protein